MRYIYVLKNAVLILILIIMIMIILVLFVDLDADSPELPGVCKCSGQ